MLPAGRWTVAIKFSAPRLLSSVAAVVLYLAAARDAAADPQWNTGLTFAGCHLRQGSGHTSLGFCGGARGDVFFLREQSGDWGLGPYLELSTAQFKDLRIGAGASLLAPVHRDFPLIFSLGLLSRQVTELGVQAQVFWGLRSYNHHAGYNMSGGLVLGFEQTVTEPANRVVSVGLRIDGFLLALPYFLMRGAVE